MIRRLLFALFFSVFAFWLPAQESQWELLTVDDGLPSNNLSDIILIDTTSYYLASDSGLYIQSVNQNFTFNTKNSNLASNNILELLLVKGELWLHTDSGLSKYDGRSFTNYNETNGLLTNRINDIAVDTNETIWIASNAGVSRYDGVQFTHDSGKVAKTIEVDDSNRVYISRYTLIFNIPSAGLVPIEIYDGQQWIVPQLGSFSDTYRSQFYKTPEGKIYLLPTGGGNQFYGELIPPMEIRRKEIYTRAPYGRTPTYINEFSNFRWLGYASASSIYKSLSKDSVYQAQYLLKREGRIRDVSQFDDQLAIATDLGLLIGPAQSNDPRMRRKVDVNQIGAAMNAIGSLFGDYEGLKSDFEFPIGSGKYLFRNVDFQYGVIRDTSKPEPEQELFNLELFSQNYESGPKHSSNRRLGDRYVVKIDKQTIDQHRQNFNQANYTVPSEILDWPAASDSTLTANTDMAPFIDLNNNDCYEPLLGEYPAIEGDQAIYWINHPKADIPLEFHWMLYAYTNPIDTFLNRTVFLKFRVINRDSNKLDYLKFALQVNADLGNPNDDFNGSDSSRNSIYFYNGDLVDENRPGISGYRLNPPAIGVTLLSEGLQSGIFFQTNAGINPEATIWNQLHGLNGDGSSFINPFNLSGTAFQYSGDPFTNTGWTELNLVPNKVSGNLPGERRGTMGISLFSLDAGEMKSLDFAFTVAQGAFRNGNAEYVPSLRTMIDRVQLFYDNRLPQNPSYGQFFNCALATDIEEKSIEKLGLLVYPNPTEGSLTIESSRSIERLEIWSMSGKKVMDLNGQGRFASLQLPNLNNGIYLLRVFDGQDWKQEKIIIRR